MLFILSSYNSIKAQVFSAILLDHWSAVPAICFHLHPISIKPTTPCSNIYSVCESHQKEAALFHFEQLLLAQESFFCILLAVKIKPYSNHLTPKD